MRDSDAMDGSPDPELTAQVAAAAPFTAFLGIEMVSASPHEVVARLAWSEDTCTAGGVMHGGALMGLADNVGGFCAFLNLPEAAAGTATIESKTNFFAAVREGHVHAVSRPLHTGRRTIVVDTELYDDAGRLVARVTQTQAVL
jgi:1,4-dihydroxy-2-naphthoyl-CoA hydrolase